MSVCRKFYTYFYLLDYENWCQQTLSLNLSLKTDKTNEHNINLSKTFLANITNIGKDICIVDIWFIQHIAVFHFNWCCIMEMLYISRKPSAILCCKLYYYYYNCNRYFISKPIIKQSLISLVFKKQLQDFFHGMMQPSLCKILIKHVEFNWSSRQPIKGMELHIKEHKKAYRKTVLQESTMKLLQNQVV